MSMRILGDAALPPVLEAMVTLSEHLPLVLGIVAGVAAVTVLLVVLLNRKKRGK